MKHTSGVLCNIGPLSVRGGIVNVPTATLPTLVTAATALLWQADLNIQPKVKITPPLRLLVPSGYHLAASQTRSAIRSQIPINGHLVTCYVSLKPNCDIDCLEAKQDW